MDDISLNINLKAYESIVEILYQNIYRDYYRNLEFHLAYNNQRSYLGREASFFSSAVAIWQRSFRDTELSGVCLSVCLSTFLVSRKLSDKSFWNFAGMLYGENDDDKKKRPKTTKLPDFQLWV